VRLLSPSNPEGPVIETFQNRSVECQELPCHSAPSAYFVLPASRTNWWSRPGQQALEALPLAEHTAQRRSELQALRQRLAARVSGPEQMQQPKTRSW